MMEEEEEEEEEDSYLEMLCSGDELGESCIFSSPSSIPSSSSSCCASATAAARAPMLYFGGKEQEEEVLLPQFHGNPLRQKYSSDSSMSSSLSPPSSTITSSKTTKKKVGSSVTGGRRNTNATTTTSMSTATGSKKHKALSSGNTKVRRERLGDRIVALQQMVSPFGKSDTSSVLHEALGYIRFLHDQVQVLSSPYLQQRLSSSANDEERRHTDDLRSRGLCLVPVSCTEHVTNSNGADLWSPTMRRSSNCPSSSEH